MTAAPILPPCLAAMSEAVFLARRAIDLIEARDYGDELGAIVGAIHAIEPDWLEDQAEQRLADAIAAGGEDAPDEEERGERSLAWHDAGYWLRGEQPPPRFRMPPV